MTNETTASQPKSIGDDAQFQKRLAEYDAAIYPGQKALRLVSLIALIDSRAPAAQASATIQAAPDDLVAKIRAIAAELDQEANNYEGDFADTVSGCAEELERLCAATIQEPVMVAEPVGEGQAQTSAAFPLMRAAFETSESGPDGYFIKFKFPTLVAMQKAHIEWIAAQLTDSTLAAPMVADPAGVATVYEWRHRHAEHMPWGEWKLCDKDQYDLVVERTRQNLSLQSSTKLDEVRATLAATVKAVPSEAVDTKLLDALGNESWNLECFDMPTGGDDADIGWRVVGHYMAEPIRRIVAEVYEDNPRAAIKAALAAPLADKTGGGE